METVNIHHAKTHLSKLLEQVVSGNEEIIIAKAGKPMAKLVPYKEEKRRIKPGFMKGEKFWMAPDFDAPLPEEIMRYFRGEGED